MYLINVCTTELERFDADVPPYAILSHRWREGEVSFSEFQRHLQRSKRPGFAKIRCSCAQARRDGLRYVWVDTCCIDKSSSAELSEAINSMYQWYRRAKVCYAYLDDVLALHDTNHPLAKSEWFKRGWTLQELIAPEMLWFFCNLDRSRNTWDILGHRNQLADLVARVTCIPETVFLCEFQLQEFTVLEKMSWAAKRRTTRDEDAAYCLMGLFDVNMPLLYGEGSKAFLRLQEEIVKNTDDDTIFAWREPRSNRAYGELRGIFAPSPASFVSPLQAGRISSMAPNNHLEITSRGLRTNTTVSPTWEMLKDMGVQELDKSYLLLPPKLLQGGGHTGE
ncbi:cell cycle checkpoint protein RAD17 [Apiospora arundinis]